MIPRHIEGATQDLFESEDSRLAILANSHVSHLDLASLASVVIPIGVRPSIEYGASSYGAVPS